MRRQKAEPRKGGVLLSFFISMSDYVSLAHKTRLHE